jgi:hypothetical protein
MADLLNSAQRFASRAAHETRRQAERAMLELDIRRLEGRIEKEEAAIGRLLYPLLADGTLKVDVPGIESHIEEIRRTSVEVAQKRTEVAALRTDTAEALSVEEASKNLQEALARHRGPVDFSVDDPVVRAITEYGDRCRKHDDAGAAEASRKVYEAITRHIGPRDFASDERLVRALSEYGAACRAQGSPAESQPPAEPVENA